MSSILEKALDQEEPEIIRNGFVGSRDYDYVNPAHYQNGSKEVWEMMVDIWGKDKYIAHCEMCAFKYRQRLGLKPGQPVERDLEKARWYENKAKELRASNG